MRFIGSVGYAKLIRALLVVRGLHHLYRVRQVRRATCRFPSMWELVKAK